MIGWLRRTLSFSRFTLNEYVRSGRVLVEILALVVVAWIFFNPRDVSGFPESYFFTYTGIFIPALAAVTTAMIMRLGNRPPGYIVLSRTLGRSGYLVGLYLTAVFVSTVAYLLLLSFVVGINRLMPQAAVFSPQGWILGTLPVLLNVAIVAAFVTFLMPLVLPKGLRLAGLVVLAVALSEPGQYLNALGAGSFGSALGRIVDTLAILILPAARGYKLGVDHVYDSYAIETLLSQLALLVVVLALALLGFCRRELVFES